MLLARSQTGFSSPQWQAIKSLEWTDAPKLSVAIFFEKSLPPWSQVQTLGLPRMADDYLTVARTNPGIKGAPRALSNLHNDHMMRRDKTSRQPTVSTLRDTSIKPPEKLQRLGKKGYFVWARPGFSLSRENSPGKKRARCRLTKRNREKDANSVVNGNLAATKLEVESADSSNKSLRKLLKTSELSTALKQLTVVLKI
ncbi:hypothetical protein H4Q26_004998 [Puccinia striiformis f. sp. tritici PST-130]|nr:hypothetical protein H4Q26_004998 [Puccinia striiformis f. sp. tritici PST-130]